MAAPLAIRATALRKVYRIYGRPMDVFAEALFRTPRHVERVALDRVDLEVARGEIVGVLGRNGAGKSTLLKLVAGTLERTSGELTVNGRITAILELGTGFHPDYTGRENIYMGGLCLGMSRRDIDRKVDEIIAFSELADVIDQPFKTYSTGMQARLTFSTAISVDPDILIVDEALSVGDARFQTKCFGWIQRLREGGSTVLLVSHDTNTITTFCDRALILEGGRVLAEGPARQISSKYLRVLFGTGGSPSMDPEPAPLPEGTGSPGSDAPPVEAAMAAGKEEVGRAGPAPTSRYGNGKATILRHAFVDESGAPVSVIESGARCHLSMSLRFHEDVPDVSCGFAVKDRKGSVVFGVTNISQHPAPYSARRGEVLVVAADLVIWLSTGDYFINMGAGHLSSGEFFDFIEDAVHFKVSGPEGIFTTSIVNLQAKFSLEGRLEGGNE